MEIKDLKDLELELPVLTPQLPEAPQPPSVPEVATKAVKAGGACSLRVARQIPPFIKGQAILADRWVTTSRAGGVVAVITVVMLLAVMPAAGIGIGAIIGGLWLANVLYRRERRIEEQAIARSRYVNSLLAEKK